MKYIEWLPILLPLIGASINGLIGHRLTRRLQNWVACGAVVGAGLIIMPLLWGQIIEPGLVGRSVALPWLRVWSGAAFIQIALRLRVDAISILAASTTVAVGLFIHLYVARSATARSRRRTLARLNGALAILLLLEFADNFWVLLLGWSLSGWIMWTSSSRRASSPIASLGADLCLLLATAMIDQTFASASIDHLGSATLAPERLLPLHTAQTIIVICALAGVLARATQYSFRAGPRRALIALWVVPSSSMLLLARIYPLLTETRPAPPPVAWYGALWALWTAIYIGCFVARRSRRAWRLPGLFNGLGDAIAKTALRGGQYLLRLESRLAGRAHRKRSNQTAETRLQE